MKLHIGCGNDPKEGWVNLNLVDGEGVDVVHDLEGIDPLPYDDDTFDELMGLHVIEHIYKPLPVMQELWRVAQPDAVLTLACPYGASDDAWEDATHVRPYFVNSWAAFGQPYFWRAYVGYDADWQVEDVAIQVRRDEYEGIKPMDIYVDLMQRRNVAVQQVAILRAVKPAREPRKELLSQPRISFQLVDVN